jgi:hypothetical protein
VVYNTRESRVANAIASESRVQKEFRRESRGNIAGRTRVKFLLKKININFIEKPT